MIVGIVAFGAYALGTLIFKRTKKKEIYALGVSAFIGVLTNTLTVLFAMYFTDFTTLSGVFSAIVSFNFPIELVATTLLTPFLVLGVRRGLKIEKIGQKQSSDSADQQ